MLLGVVKSVFMQTVPGDVRPVPAPTGTEEQNLSMPNDRGLCTRGDALLRFEKHFLEKMERGGTG